MTATTTSPVAEIAAILDAPLKERDCGTTVDIGGGVYIYASIVKVRLHRPGQPVTDLGAWDDVAGVVAAFRAAVA